jgi:hypothetical protein
MSKEKLKIMCKDHNSKTDGTAKQKEEQQKSYFRLAATKNA